MYLGNLGFGFKNVVATVYAALMVLLVVSSDVEVIDDVHSVEVSAPSFCSKIVIVEEEVPFESLKRENALLQEGKSKVIQQGGKGIKQVSYEIFYQNDQEISKEELGVIVALDSTDEIIEIGTRRIEPKKASESFIAIAEPGQAVSRSGDSLRYSKVINACATAYSLVDVGKASQGYAYTASGRKAARGIVAVDPKVIPLGTRLYIEAIDGSWVYGHAIAGDTGGAVKNNIVDLFFDTYQEVVNFGRRPARVYVLE